MPSAMVVFESMYGDAREVAEAIGRGLSARMDVVVLEVSAAPEDVPLDVDLLVVGSPTHAFGLPRPQTREEAKTFTDAPLVSSGIGIREWLDRLPKVQRPVSAATFDTRMEKPKTLTMMDHAAKSAKSKLRKHGLTIVADSEYFVVVDRTGPLADGEVVRAQGWGRALADKVLGADG